MANRYSFDSTQQEHSNEYQHDRVRFFKNIFLLFCASDESNLSSRRVKILNVTLQWNPWAVFTFLPGQKGSHIRGLSTLYYEQMELGKLQSRKHVQISEVFVIRDFNILCEYLPYVYEMVLCFLCKTRVPSLVLPRHTQTTSLTDPCPSPENTQAPLYINPWTHFHQVSAHMLWQLWTNFFKKSDTVLLRLSTRVGNRLEKKFTTGLDTKARMRGSHFAKRALSVNLMLSKMWLRRPLSKVWPRRPLSKNWLGMQRSYSSPTLLSNYSPTK